MMLLISQKEHLEREALIELRGRYKRKRAKSRFGRKFWAVPNFQKTTFKVQSTADRIGLSGGHTLLVKEHRPFIGTGEYIVTYQIIKI